MDKTPKAKHNKYPNNITKSAGSGSPMQQNSSSRNDLSFDYSPILSQYTNDNYDVDVIWDWSSPRTKTNVRRGKRQHTSEQEKPPLKKTPSGNHLPTFDQLKKKLEALKEEITAEKKDEKHLNSCCVGFDHSSKRQINYDNHFMEDIPKLEELFNDDSFEEQLLLCSQKVENYLIVPTEDIKIKTNENEINNLLSVSNNTIANNIDIKINGVAEKDIRIANNSNVEISKPKKFFFKPSYKAQTGSLKDIFDAVKPKPNNSENKVNKPTEDDSFESVLAIFENDDMELLNEVDTRETGIKLSARSPQFKKTTLFDDSKLNKQDETLSKETLEEIERKRKEALAKLEARRKIPFSIPVNDTSLKRGSSKEIKKSKPIQVCFKERSKCLETGIKQLPKSPQFRKTASFDDSFSKAGSSRQDESLSRETMDEIERKRKEALAKLEARRKTSFSIPVNETSLKKSSPEEIEKSKTMHVSIKERSKCLETGIKQLPKSSQFRKTASFDDSFAKSGSCRQDESLSKETLEEIERKRKEALAKLEAKRKTPLATPVEETSPIKCSPEEIEQKRLQALAKREDKRKQEIIERNRLEALKRLEINKKKKALELQNAHRTAPKTLQYNIAQNNR